jgi:hypothetical protein
VVNEAEVYAVGTTTTLVEDSVTGATGELGEAVVETTTMTLDDEYAVAETSELVVDSTTELVVETVIGTTVVL